MDMPKEINCREWMRSIAAGGLVVAGTMTPLSSVLADQEQTDIKRGPKPQGPAISKKPATLSDGKVIQPQRELSILRKTGVLVVGGGPAGIHKTEFQRQS
jgi:hypothetical protein